MANRPLILSTNDDGIESPGLRAAAEAVADLGDLLIVAPSSQRSGAGRSFPHVPDKTIYPPQLQVNGSVYTGYKADISPAQAVVLALVKLAPRPVDLCISGINYGENLGSGITASGTVGAALEAASADVPALAISLETAQVFHMTLSESIDFGAAAHFTRYFARQVLNRGLPTGVDLLKIDVPATATPQTPWQPTIVSRQRYFHPLAGEDDEGDIGYHAYIDHDTLELGSDIEVISRQKQVSVAPVTIDLSAAVELQQIPGFFADDLPGQ